MTVGSVKDRLGPEGAAGQSSVQSSTEGQGSNEEQGEQSGTRCRVHMSGVGPRQMQDVQEGEKKPDHSRDTVVRVTLCPGFCWLPSVMVTMTPPTFRKAIYRILRN